ncbi:MAG: hypothetical protein ABUT39_00245, partial [Acidobacteriota bacterium]
MDRRATSRPLRQPGWRSLDILRAAALVMGLYLALRLLWVAYPLLFVSFLGLLFGLAVARGADFLERFRIPRGLGSALVVFGFVGILVGIGLWIAPTLREQTRLLRAALPEAIGRAEDWLDRHALIGQLLQEPEPEPTPAPEGRSTPATPGRDQAAQAEAAGARAEEGWARKTGLPRTFS